MMTNTNTDPTTTTTNCYAAVSEAVNGITDENTGRVWGVGATPDLARADAADFYSGDVIDDLRVEPLNAAQAQAIESGEVHWLVLAEIEDGTEGEPPTAGQLEALRDDPEDPTTTTNRYAAVSSPVNGIANENTDWVWGVGATPELAREDAVSSEQATAAVSTPVDDFYGGFTAYLRVEPITPAQAQAIDGGTIQWSELVALEDGTEGEPPTTYSVADANGRVDVVAESAEAAAESYVRDGSWGPEAVTSWTRVSVHPIDDPDAVTSHLVTVDPEEPPCTEGQHEWVDGPVCGSGGGVRWVSTCAHCGCTRTTDTWATDPTTGEQGLQSVEYT